MYKIYLPTYLYVCMYVCIGNEYDRLVKSFAPSVWEMDDAKRGELYTYIHTYIHTYIDIQYYMKLI